MKKLTALVMGALLLTSCVKTEIEVYEPQQVCKEGYNLTLIVTQPRHYLVSNWISLDSITLNNSVTLQRDLGNGKRVSFGGNIYFLSELTLKCFK